ncbi:MAG: hypothetical protein ACI4QS_10905 [Comamonas sp.]
MDYLDLYELFPEDWPDTKRMIAIELFRNRKSYEQTQLKDGACDASKKLADAVIKDLEEILEPIDGDARLNVHEAWQHPPVHGSPKFVNRDLHDLSDCAERYLSYKKAHSPTLELWLTRAMIYEELHAFREECAPHLERKTILKKIFALGPSLWSATILISALWTGFNVSVVAGIALYLVLQACLVFKELIRAKFLTKASQVLADLSRAYQHSIQPKPSPSEINHALALAEAVGARWPHRLRDLVCYAKHRSSYFWE